MYIQLGAKPESAFHDPLGLLSDCHRRIEHFLSILLKIGRNAPTQGLPLDYRQALEVSLRYFREAAPKHTADEEESLFPRLRAVLEGQQGLHRVESLQADHRWADCLHQKVEELGLRWQAESSLSPLDRCELMECLEKLEALYAEHIRIEDNDLFPLAAQVLDIEHLQDVGREMAARRGLCVTEISSATALH